MRRRDMVAALVVAALVMVTAALCGAFVFGEAQAQQTYPTHTVRLILPFKPGSATDTTARLFADRLAARWGYPVVVENRPGGDGLVDQRPGVDWFVFDANILFLRAGGKP